MADDPYRLLGVPRTASDGDIRKAFRKLAKELHPDARPDDPAAAERFKKISQAYDLLGDADKRAKFDRGEIDAAGEPRRPAYSGAAGGYGGAYAGPRRPSAGARGRAPGDDFSFGDIFDGIFGGTRGGAKAAGFGGGFDANAPYKGHDVRYTLDVDFIEAAIGAKKRVTLPDGAVLDITVPEGVTDGQVLRLRGKGGTGQRDAPAGDALIEMRVRNHPEFRRDGYDILATLPISIDEAVLGSKIEVETISGRVQLTIPKGTSAGRVFRLKGKGIRSTTTGQTGDHLVTVSIQLPETIDESLAYFMSEWRGRYPYNPRKRR